MREKVLKIWPEINWIENPEIKRKSFKLLDLCNREFSSLTRRFRSDSLFITN